MILLIDNYDSFSYNLVQFFGTLCLENKGPLTPPSFGGMYRNGTGWNGSRRTRSRRTRSRRT